MTDERAAELLEAMRALSLDVRANTLMLAGVRDVLLEDGGEVEADEPAPIATYADGTPIG